MVSHDSWESFASKQWVISQRTALGFFVRTLMEKLSPWECSGAREVLQFLAYSLCSRQIKISALTGLANVESYWGWLVMLRSSGTSAGFWSLSRKHGEWI